MVGFVVALVLAGFAFYQRGEADKQRKTAETIAEIAETRRVDAEQQRGIAEDNARMAQRERDRAVAAETEAVTQKAIAEDNAKIAQEEKNRAVTAETEAVTQKAIAEDNAKIAQEEKNRSVAAEKEAVRQQSIAEENARIAQAEKDRAVTAETEAKAQRDRAVTAEAEATAERDRAVAAEKDAKEQARIAMSRKLAADAISNLEVDLELSILLALEAVKQAGSSEAKREAEDALHQAVQAPRIRQTLSGHSQGVNHITFSLDGKSIATASDDGTAKVWETASGQVVPLFGHAARVNSAAFSPPDGKRVATASDDRTAKVWNAKSGKTQFSLSGHAKTVSSIAFSPDGKRIATTSTLLMSIGMGIVPLAAEVSMFMIPILIVGQIFQSIGLTVYSINQISLRQAITPNELLGRVNASRRVLVFGVIPFGAMISGALGETIGLQFTLVVGAIVEFLSFVFHLASPLRHVMDFRKVSK